LVNVSSGDIHWRSSRGEPTPWPDRHPAQAANRGAIPSAATMASAARGASTCARNDSIQRAARQGGIVSEQQKDIDHYLRTEGLDSAREQEIGQHIGYRYDVNLLPDYARLTPFLKQYIETMGWDDLNWLEDVHMGYEEGRPAVFDRNINGWITVPENMTLPDNQQDRDMLARELLVKFQMSRQHPLVELKKAYAKF
jgi:hypothetical protein